MKNTLLIIVTILFIVSLVYLGKTRSEIPVVVLPPQPLHQDLAPKPIKLCFYKETKTSRGLYDVSWLSMNLNGSKVTGEFQNLPAEKDKKVGLFEGTVSDVDKVAMARTADVWWDSMAEGMQVKEQLKIMFGEGDARAAYGEMVDRGDGVYIYKVGSKLTYGETMTDIACEDIPVKIAVTKIQGNSCYSYHKDATTDAPYKVDGYINLKVSGNTVTGTKRGTQAGPDMNNGYGGTLKGTLDKASMNLLFAYTIEGSKNSEKEIYNITPEGLEKIRYPLIDVKGVLTPDMTKEAKKMPYNKVDCSLIK